jgi:6-phosphogluconolactonase/glucosamine-6-phosphate isomerase/deaminase
VDPADAQLKDDNRDGGSVLLKFCKKSRPVLHFRNYCKNDAAKWGNIFVILSDLRYDSNSHDDSISSQMRC